jgi:hypothetical protein
MFDNNQAAKTEATKLENSELRDEIQKWKRDHAQKLQDRKEYFEPQILKIDDTYEAPLSDNDDDNNNNNNNDHQYDEYHSLKSLEDNISTISLDDENKKSNAHDEFDESIRVVSGSRQKEREEKREKKQRDRKHRSKSRTASVLPDVRIQERSTANSRLATSDTGYESISNLRDLEHTYFDRDQHKPKIAASINNNKLTTMTTTGVAVAADQNSYITNGNSFSLATRPVSVTLNKLKTPLAPLTAIKLNPK